MDIEYLNAVISLYVGKLLEYDSYNNFFYSLIFILCHMNVCLRVFCVPGAYLSVPWGHERVLNSLRTGVTD